MPWIARAESANLQNPKCQNNINHSNSQLFNIMKKIFSSLALLAAVASGSAAPGYHSLTVNLNNGSTVEVNLAAEMKASFTKENFVISGGENDIKVPRTDIASFTFNEAAFDGIEAVGADTAAPVIDGDNMMFGNLPEGSVVAVYAVNGVLLSQATVSGSYVLSLSTLPAGTVIVNVNGISYKIALTK